MTPAAVTFASLFEGNPEAVLWSIPVGLFLLGLPFVGLSSWRRKRREEREERVRLLARTARRNRAEAELRDARHAGEIRPVEDSLPILLERGETAYWCEPSDLSETRTERTFSGFTTDWQALEAFSLGRIHAKENARDVWKRIDSGHLVLTDRRLVFAGSAEQREFPLGAIVSVQGTPEALAVGASGHAKKMFFSSRNGLLAEWTAKHLAEAAR